MIMIMAMVAMTMTMMMTMTGKAAVQPVWPLLSAWAALLSLLGGEPIFYLHHRHRCHLYLHLHFHHRHNNHHYGKKPLTSIIIIAAYT